MVKKRVGRYTLEVPPDSSEAHEAKQQHRDFGERAWVGTKVTVSLEGAARSGKCARQKDRAASQDT